MFRVFLFLEHFCIYYHNKNFCTLNLLALPLLPRWGNKIKYSSLASERQHCIWMKICVSNIFRTSLRTCQSAKTGRDWFAVGGGGGKEALSCIWWSHDYCWQMAPDNKQKEVRGGKDTKRETSSKGQMDNRVRNFFMPFQILSAPPLALATQWPFLHTLCATYRYLFPTMWFLSNHVYAMALITASCTMSWISIHSFSGLMSIRSNPLNLFVTFTVQS